MNLDDFRRIDARFREEKPKVFLLSTPDMPATIEQLDAIERELQIGLPEKYRQFLMAFGGGNFGLTTVFSADPGSEWYLPAKQSAAVSYLPSGVLAFSDDFSGGNYVFKVEKGKAGESVFYWNQDGGIILTQYADVFEFVARTAYESA